MVRRLLPRTITFYPSGAAQMTLRRIQANKYNPETNTWKVEGWIYDIEDDYQCELTERWVACMELYGYEIIHTPLH